MGAPSGMKTVAAMPCCCAASATPCAWFPADAATTPRARSSSESRAIRTEAPRILNEPVRWRFSHLRWTGTPASPESQRDSSIGVGTAAASTSGRAARMSARVTAGSGMARLVGWVDDIVLELLGGVLDRHLRQLGEMEHDRVQGGGDRHRDECAHDAGDEHAAGDREDDS